MHHLFFVIGGTALYLYGFLNDSLSKYTIAIFPIILLSAFQTYRQMSKSLKKKNSK